MSQRWMLRGMLARLRSSVSLPHHHLLIFLALGLCQCGLSRQVTIHTENRVRIIYHQEASRSSGLFKGITNGQEIAPLTQTLVTEAVVKNRQQFYSDRRSDQLTKVLPTEDMQLLLDGMATAGFFAQARAQVMPGTSAYLQAEVDGEHYFLSRTKGMEPAARAAFTQSLVAFLDLYNATSAYRSGDDKNKVIEEHEKRQRIYRNQRRLDQNRGGR